MQDMDNANIDVIIRIITIAFIIVGSTEDHIEKRRGLVNAPPGNLFESYCNAVFFLWRMSYNLLQGVLNLVDRLRNEMHMNKDIASLVGEDGPILMNTLLSTICDRQ